MLAGTLGETNKLSGVVLWSAPLPPLKAHVRRVANFRATKCGPMGELVALQRKSQPRARGAESAKRLPTEGKDRSNGTEKP